MSDDTRRILDLLAQGKITVDQADELIKATLGAAAPTAAAADPAPAGDKPRARFIRIAVHKSSNERRPEQDVNIRVPIALLRGGMRLGAMIPEFAGERMRAKLAERGIDVDLAKLDSAQFEAMLRELGDCTIDVEEGHQQVRISCE